MRGEVESDIGKYTLFKLYQTLFKIGTLVLHM